MKIKHTVLMVTYNHEQYIEQALNSILLNQSIIPDKICICDDCSTDNTFSIILGYAKRFDNILAIKNETNLGVYGNINKLLSYASGDVVSFLSGDDYLTPNLFERFNNAIFEYGIDFHNESFIIITNSVHLHPNGRQTIFNNFRLKDTNLLKARLRYGLSFRSVGISSNTLKKCEPFRDDLGIMADWIWGFDKLVYSDKFVFLNEQGAVYRLGVGITSREINLSSIKSKEKVLGVITEKFGFLFDKSDFRYIKFLYSKINYEKSKGTIRYSKMLFHFLLNLNNFTPNNSWSRNLSILLPSCLVAFLLKIKIHVAILLKL